MKWEAASSSRTGASPPLLETSLKSRNTRLVRPTWLCSPTLYSPSTLPSRPYLLPPSRVPVSASNFAFLLGWFLPIRHVMLRESFGEITSCCSWGAKGRICLLITLRMGYGWSLSHMLSNFRNVRGLTERKHVSNFKQIIYSQTSITCSWGVNCQSVKWLEAV